MKNINQKGYMQLILIIFIILAIALGIYLVQQKTNLLPKASGPESFYSLNSNKINNADDLERNLKNLDDTDLNRVDQEISQNSSAASNL